jgi:hypothetical protein
VPADQRGLPARAFRVNAARDSQSTAVPMGADLLLVASPTYKGIYTGLLKRERR